MEQVSAAGPVSANVPEVAEKSKQIEYFRSTPVLKSQHSEAHAMLSVITTELQEGKASHAEAAISFGTLIDTLPAGKLRGCALLNRAHCFVTLGKNADALSDIDSI